MCIKSKRGEMRCGRGGSLKCGISNDKPEGFGLVEWQNTTLYSIIIIKKYNNKIILAIESVAKKLEKEANENATGNDDGRPDMKI